MKNKITFAILLVLFIVLFLLDIMLGSVAIPFNKTFNILLGNLSDETLSYIILHFRLPKALTAVLVGSGLSVAGLIMQTLFRNPLAGPYVLGINSGANLGVALFILTTSWVGSFFNLSITPANWGLIVAAMVGALFIFIIIFIISIYLKNNVSLLIIGIMLGSIVGSIVNILHQLSTPLQTQKFIVWTFGNLGGVSWDELQIMTIFVLVGILISALLIKSLDALLLGSDYAKLLGVDIKRIRIWIIVSTALLSGSITAFTGPIAFIGIATPHIARLVMRTATHKTLLPATILMGIIIMLLCDIVSQLPSNVTILPLNSITAIIGGTVVIWVIMKSRNKKYMNEN